MDKSPDAFRTITEVATWLDTPAHVLRFWESRFSQIKPVKRAGGRRYYRPSDMLLLGGIKKLLHDDGITIKAVQSLLREHGIPHVQSLSHPVSIQVVVKKKNPKTASKITTERPSVTREDSREIDIEAAIEQAVSTEQPAKPTALDSTDNAYTNVIKLPLNLKSATEISPKDIQDIEALYYSLKMVRNNMKRAAARR